VKFIGSLWFTPEGAKVWGLNQLPSKVRYGALKLELTNNTAANLAAMSSPKSEFILGSRLHFSRVLFQKKTCVIKFQRCQFPMTTNAF
jgi:hypothetical protein